MTSPRISGIAPPPSLDDILSADHDDTRIGAVDFTALHAPEADDAAETAPEPAAPEPEPVAVEPEPEPVAVEPEPEPAPEPVSVVAEPEPEPVAVEPEPEPEPEPVDLLPQPQPQPSVLEPEDEDEFQYLGLSVERVAGSVIARMRAAGEAHLRHLDAIEMEAARRCELLTAQAELDAELIRLHGRREAHSIITAARMRAGGETGPTADSRRLTQIDETFSRFAETIETTVAQATRAPDDSQTP